MPAAPTYPGVYIEEIPSGVRTITGVSTSVAAFIDFFARGPLNQATQIFSQADFDRLFGGLDTRSEASYAIRQFYLNGGSEAWIVRCASGAPASAEIAIRSGTSGNAVLRLRAREPGVWGNNLQARIDPVSDTAFNLTVLEVAADGTVTRQETFRNLTMTSGASHVKTVVDDSSQIVSVAEATGSALPLANGTLSDSFASFSAIAAVSTGRSVQVTIGDTTANADLGTTAINTLQEARDRLQAGIRAARPDRRSFSGATVEIVQLAAGQPRLRVLAGPGNAADKVTFAATGGDANSVNDLKLTGSAVTSNVQAYTSAGAIATSGQAAGTQGADGNPPDAAALQAALQNLKDVSFNLLCIPRTAELGATESNQVIASATAYCEQRRAFFIADIPRIATVQGIKDWLDANATLRSRNVAIYFPRVRIADPLNGFRLRTVGASGTLAGVYARTDSERGVWKAPAGTDAVLRGVQALEYVANDAENGTLNPLAINTLRSFPIYGNVAWGARTLRGADALADEYKYIPVRRTALYIEESLYRGLQWVVFEPNDEKLWSQIRLNVGAFMQNLFRQGAFQGTTPREAYLVKCDAETTTQNDINLGIVNVLVGFAPLRPAEFVIIRIQQLAGQIEV